MPRRRSPYDSPEDAQEAWSGAEELHYDRYGNVIVPPHERVMPPLRKREKAKSHKLFILGLIVLSIVVLTHMGNDGAKPTTDTTSAIQDATPTVEPYLPKYIGVPEANLTASWGKINQYGGYGTCPTNTVFDAWKVGFDQNTGRVNRIGPRDGCFPTTISWETWSRSFLPPDAVEVDRVIETGGTVALHYVSDWLKLRIGQGDIMIRGTPETNDWVAFVGWIPSPAS